MMFFACDWTKLFLISDVETAWTYFQNMFVEVVNQHAPIRKFRVNGWDNPWFSDELPELIDEKNVAWVKARQSDQVADWLVFP